MPPSPTILLGLLTIAGDDAPTLEQLIVKQWRRERRTYLAALLKRWEAEEATKRAAKLAARKERRKARMARSNPHVDPQTRLL